MLVAACPLRGIPCRPGPPHDLRTLRNLHKIAADRRV
jgi:hypothetical protein